MAEFQVVMKQVKRMCKEHDKCGDCALREMADKADIYCPIQTMRKLDAAKVEAAVMDWAAKHPEPRYPTWNAWLVSMGLAYVYGGADTYRLEINSSGFEPIPADIAEKLGIKPMGGDEQ